MKIKPSVRRAARIILIVLLIALITIQFIRPPKNLTRKFSTKNIRNTIAIPDSVENILKVACYDCHTDNTRYPWYAHLQPVMWYLSDHINQGKRQLNFDSFEIYSPRRQYKKLKGIGSEVKSGDMPLSSYTLIHRDADLDSVQKETIINWSQAAMEKMRTMFSIDSLASPKIGDR